jgi:hypothetical protein
MEEAQGMEVLKVLTYNAGLVDIKDEDQIEDDEEDFGRFGASFGFGVGLDLENEDHDDDGWEPLEPDPSVEPELYWDESEKPFNKKFHREDYVGF